MNNSRGAVYTYRAARLECSGYHSGPCNIILRLPVYARIKAALVHASAMASIVRSRRALGFSLENPRARITRRALHANCYEFRSICARLRFPGISIRYRFASWELLRFPRRTSNATCPHAKSRKWRFTDNFYEPVATEILRFSVISGKSRGKTDVSKKISSSVISRERANPSEIHYIIRIFNAGNDRPIVPILCTYLNM